MRFSYIDSQGKEIEVDSVESLALRIELGAIQPETRMYDAVADRWAPAEEHPVYRSLSRGEEVAEDEVIPIGHDEVEEVAQEEVLEEEEEEEPAGASSDDPLGLDFSVTMPEDGEDPGRSPDSWATQEIEPYRPDTEESEAEPSSGDEEVAEDMEGAAEEGEAELEEVAGIDSFEDVGMLELEEDEEEDLGGAGDEDDAESVVEPDSAFAGEDSIWEEGPATDDGPADEPAEEAAGGGAAWVDEGESLWEEESEGVELGSGSRSGRPEILDEDPADPGRRLPEWAAREEAAPDVDEIPASRKERAAQAPRPAHWEERREARKRRANLVRMGQIAAGVVLVIAGAGYFVFGSSGDGGGADDPAAAPVLTEDLRGVMESASTLAFDDVLRAYRNELDAMDIAAAPPSAWLEGIYLSTASAYPRVPSYWEQVEDVVASFRSREASLFEERLEARLSSTSEEAAPGVAGANLDLRDEVFMMDEAMADYRATAGERDAVYAGVLDVATSSLELHAFLISREEDIAYEPYSDPNVSRDPVLEAVPNDSTLRVEMNDRLDRVIESMVGSGVPRPITTGSLFDHLLARLEEVGVVDDTPPQTQPPE